MKFWYPVFLILIMAAPAYGQIPPNLAQPMKAQSEVATLTGQLLVNDSPMANGYVFLYDKSAGPPPSFVKYWRVPDHTFPADQDGKFAIRIPPGAYYVQISQKDPDSDLGPATVDEYNYVHGGIHNPLPLIATSGTTLNLGTLKTYKVPVKLQQFDKGITSIAGVVSNMDGKPAMGMMVFAYLTDNTTGRPVFVSTKTDIEGRYVLRVHDGGKFYLKVRGVIGGGVPSVGELVSIDEKVMVELQKEQKLTGVALKVKRFSKGRRGQN